MNCYNLDTSSNFLGTVNCIIKKIELSKENNFLDSVIGNVWVRGDEMYERESMSQYFSYIGTKDIIK